MSKRVKLCLALFLALAVLAQYSFSPQIMVAYGADGEVSAAADTGDSGQTAEKEKADNSSTAPTKAPESSAPTTESTQATEATEPTESAEQSDVAGEEDDAYTGDPIAGEDPAAVEEEEEEEGYPAQDFSGSANGVSVKVSAPKGALPEGTDMKVSGVSDAQVQAAVEGLVDGDVANLKAVDISFRCDGKEIEPKKAVSVHMTASGVTADKVVHIADSGSANVVSASTSGSSASFKSADFSVYIVVEEEDESQDINAVATYEFYVGEELKSSQNIKTGDTLVDPGTLGAGDGAHSIFKGWYVAGDQTISGETPGSKLTFGTKANVPKTETIKIEAMVETTYYVTFFGEKINDERGIVSVETVTVTGEAGTAGTLDISGKTITPKADTSAFEGWSETDGGAVITDTTITVTGNKQLYAKVVDANWIHFDENVTYPADSDPTYTGPVFVKKTDDLSTKKPANPTRKGYKFEGWYKEAACTNAFSWSGTGLEEDITLYAKWTPDEATYTVIIWKQKVTDAKDAADDAKKYDFEESDQLTGTTGETLDAADFVTYTTHNYTGFHYNRIKIDPATVKADGTTVVNVYYDRNLLTIRFVAGTHEAYVPTTSNNGNQFGLVEGEYVSLTRENEGWPWNPDYHWYYQAQHDYTGTTYRQATGNNGTQYGLVGGQMVQLERRNGAWYYGNQRYYGTRYFEGAQGSSGYGVVDGEVIGISHNDEGWHYVTDTEYTGTRYVVGTEPDVTEFTGLYGSTLESNGYEWPDERDWYQNPNRGGTHLTFLDAFKFEGLSGVSEGNTVLTQYGANPTGSNTIRFYKQNIDGSWPTTPTNTVTASSGGTFTITEKYEGFKAVSYSNGYGWSNTQAGASVSSNNLSIRFERQKYNLTFVSEGTTVASVQGIPYEQVMSQYESQGGTPTKKHHEFVGWCEDPEGVASFDWSSKMPAANKVLYAKFKEVEYHVSLDANGGEIGGTQYSEFNVTPGTKLSRESLTQNLSYDSKHEFVGWFYKTGTKAGSPYEYDKVEEDVSLIAKWRIPGQVSIIYDAGEGGTLDGQPDNYKYATDSDVVLAAPPTVNDGYTFVGWKLQNSKEELLDTIYYPGNTFKIDESLIQNYNGDTKTGEIHVVAVYIKAGEGPFEKTYIRWFKNDGSDCFHVDTLESSTGDTADSTLLVNEPVAIQPAPTRPGYEFLGWAKVEDTGDSINKKQDLTADNLFIKYDGSYKSAETGDVCTQVAADNDRQYQAMFAVWEKTALDVTVKVTGSTKHLTYNGQEQKNEDYTLEWYVNGEKVDAKPDGVTFTLTSGPAKGTNANAPYEYYESPIAGTLTAAEDSGYTIPENAVEVDSEKYRLILYIDKAPATITVADKTITYGEEPSDLGTAIVTATDAPAPNIPAADLKVHIGQDPKPTDVGTHIDALYPEHGLEQWYNDNYTNYDFTVELGNLTITAKEITVKITGNTGTGVYNGTVQSVTGFDYSVEGAKKSDVTVTLAEGKEATAARKDVGTTKMGLEKADFEVKAGKNYTVVYTYEDGQMTVTPKPVTIKADDKSKAYSAADPELTATVTGLIGDDKISYDLSRESGEAVGTYKIIVSHISAAGTKTGNYDVTAQNGTFTITGDTTPTPTPTPTPDGDGTPGTPVAAATIDDAPAPTTINDEPAPKAATAYWALINLLCAIATALLSLIMLIRYFGKRRYEEEVMDPATGQTVTRDVDEQRKGLARIASLIPAIGGIIAFIVTEDMSLPMAMVDKWTVLMVVILAIQAGVGIFAKVRDNNEEEDDEAMA